MQMALCNQWKTYPLHIRFERLLGAKENPKASHLLLPWVDLLDKAENDGHDN